MRIDLLPENGGLRFEIVTEPIDPAIFFPDREHGADVRTIRHPDWAGAHKWADRDWLESVEAELGEEVPLILTDEGEVLEAGRANVFIVIDGGIATRPPTAASSPAPPAPRPSTWPPSSASPPPSAASTWTTCARADDLFLTSSLRGIRPVRSVDGDPSARKTPSSSAWRRSCAAAGSTRSRKPPNVN